LKKREVTELVLLQRALNVECRGGGSALNKVVIVILDPSMTQSKAGKFLKINKRCRESVQLKKTFLCIELCLRADPNGEDFLRRSCVGVLGDLHYDPNHGTEYQHAILGRRLSVSQLTCPFRHPLFVVPARRP